MRRYKEFCAVHGRTALAGITHDCKQPGGGRQTPLHTTSSTPSSKLQNTSNEDPDLAAVIRAWPNLPEAMRAGIMAMVRAATDEHRPKGQKERESGLDDASLEDQRDE